MLPAEFFEHFVRGLGPASQYIRIAPANSFDRFLEVLPLLLRELGDSFRRSRHHTHKSNSMTWLC